MDHERDIDLVEDLRQQPGECEWLEFKSNFADPQKIGELCSALSNSARIAEKDYAYVVWGIQDGSHNIIGTKFNPGTKKVGNQDFGLWLTSQLEPKISVDFRIVEHPEGRLILLEIPATYLMPVSFRNIQYVRQGSHVTKLTGRPQKFRQLIEKLRPYTWEKASALNNVSGDDVLKVLDYQTYFRLTKQICPGRNDDILKKLQADKLIASDAGAKWNILNLGAILFANDLRDFKSAGSIDRHGPRFIVYDGKDKNATVIRRFDSQKGYANGFEEFMGVINGILPVPEHIGPVFRTSRPLFPALALREIIVNALIHQDMTITGSSPLIELFHNRIEITNPGQSLIQTDRMIDQHSRSRNEVIATLMRRMGFCEEAGTGLDKVFELFETDVVAPSPKIRSEHGSTRVIMYGPEKFRDMTVQERINACYYHSVLKYLANDTMTNLSLCNRFGIDSNKATPVSLVIRKSKQAGLIKIADEAHPRSGYIPTWA